MSLAVEGRPESRAPVYFARFSAAVAGGDGIGGGVTAGEGAAMISTSWVSVASVARVASAATTFASPTRQIFNE